MPILAPTPKPRQDPFPPSWWGALSPYLQRLVTASLRRAGVIK